MQDKLIEAVAKVIAKRMGRVSWQAMSVADKTSYYSAAHDAIAAALAFTENREREIAEVREEISEIEDDILSYSSHDNADSFAVIYRRILARLQARLAELRRGMKEGSE